MSVLHVNFNKSGQGVYSISDKYSHSGMVFLQINHSSCSSPYGITIAFPLVGNEKLAEYISSGDKVDFSREQDFNSGETKTKLFFENESPAILISEIDIYKPNVVSFEGWQNVNRTQTKFMPRPRGTS